MHISQLDFIRRLAIVSLGNHYIRNNVNWAVDLHKQNILKEDIFGLQEATWDH